MKAHFRCTTSPVGSESRHLGQRLEPLEPFLRGGRLEELELLVEWHEGALRLQRLMELELELDGTNRWSWSCCPLEELEVLVEWHEGALRRDGTNRWNLAGPLEGSGRRRRPVAPNPAPNGSTVPVYPTSALPNACGLPVALDSLVAHVCVLVPELGWLAAVLGELVAALRAVVATAGGLAPLPESAVRCFGSNRRCTARRGHANPLRCPPNAADGLPQFH